MALRLSLIPPILNSLPGRAIAPVFQAQDTDTPTPTATDTPAQTPTDTPTPTATPASQSGSIAINYIYDPLYRLEEANYSTGDYYHYTYDAVGNRETQTTQLAVTSYQYDNANRLKFVNGVEYFWDDNGNLLNDGVNTYTYDSANRLKTLSSQSTVSSYQYNGLGDRLSQNGVNYTLDLNAGLTQVLNDGTNQYLYGLGRIAQVNTTTDYFLADALGSVRQLTDAQGEITLANAYEPYGVLAQTAGSAQTSYGFTGEFTDPSGMVYLRARYYSSGDGRFLTRDTWMGDYNSPLSLNRWSYTQSNPINYTDPTGMYAQLALFKPGQEYGTIENTKWSSDETRLVNQALWNIANTYARAYNTYAMEFAELDCLPQPAGTLYGTALGWRIDPYTAFLKIHSGRVTFYKHDHKYKRTYTNDQGKVVIEELDNFGLGPNKKSVYIYPNGEYSVNKFGKGDAILSEANYIRFVTHEMGHVFDHAIGDKGRTATTGNLAGGGSNTSSNGFCGTYSTYNAGWQWRASDDAWEYYADMFVGWVNRCWEPLDPLYPNQLSPQGQLRSNFMNENMPKWIYEKIHGSVK